MRAARFAIIVAAGGTVACGSGNSASYDAAMIAHGTPARGHDLIMQYGCGSCHTIPGIPGAVATVAPSLAGIANQSYIAGVLTNTPDHLREWIMDPPKVDSNTAMPNLGVDAQDARDISAYLYTLR